ncbi:serine pats1 threonine-protein kinase, partial [Mytilus galloprovincialis]
METNIEEQNTVNLQRIDEHNDDTEPDRKSVFDDPRFLDDLDMLESVANCKLSQNEYAECGLWDFAGQKEFYATHQAFITSNSVFLLVADISKDVNIDVDTSMLQRGFDSIGEYIDFWFDSIHCYANGPTDQPQSTLEPRIIVVGTGTDKINRKTLKSKIQEWQRNVIDLIKDQEKRRHLETFHYISNTESPERYT